MNRSSYNNKLRAAKRRIFQDLKRDGIQIAGVKQRKLITTYFDKHDIKRPIEVRWQDFIIGLYERGDLGELEPVKKKAKENVLSHRQKYIDYLQSREWREFRLKALDYFGNQCGLCTSTHDLQLHHKTYKNLYKETFADVIPLCRKCHKRHHNK